MPGNGADCGVRSDRRLRSSSRAGEHDVGHRPVDLARTAGEIRQGPGSLSFDPPLPSPHRSMPAACRAKSLTRVSSVGPMGEYSARELLPKPLLKDAIQHFGNDDEWR